MAARTAVTYSVGWTGHVRLQNLSQSTYPPGDFDIARPYAPVLEITCGFGFSLEYLTYDP